MSKYHKLAFLIIVLVIVAAIINVQKPVARGLDIAGGYRVVLGADLKQSGGDWPDSLDERREQMRAIKLVISERLKNVKIPQLRGITEPIVHTEDGKDDNKRATVNLVVELPGVKEPKVALAWIRQMAALEFYHMRNVRSDKNPLGEWDVDFVGDHYIFTNTQNHTVNSKTQPKELLRDVVGAPETKPRLTGADLEPRTKVGVNAKNQIVIEIKFNAKGTKKFADFTTAHEKEYLAIFYDGKLLTCPIIEEPITDGSGEVSGFQTKEKAKLVSDLLNAGALPIALKKVADEQVEPSLGKETVDRVELAGVVGLALVVVFMLLYYRLPGLIADIALCMYALFTFAIFKAVPITMSLAGVAAFILSVGMAVDANILIFERLKEELRGGKTLRAAIDAGFNRAFTAIFDSNMCTFITCAILMWYGSPGVYSFAVTLLIGVAVSMFTAFTVTRTILHLLVECEWAQKPGLYGLGTSWFARTGRGLDIVGKRAWYFLLSAVLIIPGLIVLGTSGLKPGIEFLSGTSIKAAFNKPADQEVVLRIANKWSGGSEVQLAEKKRMAFIKIRAYPGQEGFDESVYEKTLDGIGKDLNKEYGLRDGKFAGRNSVGPTISEELTRNAFWAVIFASVAIVLYLTFRFAIGGIAAGVKFGVCAVIALIHDACFILGGFAILGVALGWEVDSLFVTAVLTVIGFSVHDTIVVYDRIRENLKHRLRGETFEQLCNRSILQTFSRSINTSFTVVLTLGALIAFGGPLLRHFYVALLAGIVIGTYSSIFNATPLVVVWEKLSSGSSTPRRRAVEEKAFVSKPIVETAETPLAQKPEEQASSDTSTQEERIAAKSARIKKKKRRF